MPSHHLVGRLQDMTADELRRVAFRWAGASLRQHRSPSERRNRRLIYGRSAEKAAALVVTLRSQRQRRRSVQ